MDLYAMGSTSIVDHIINDLQEYYQKYNSLWDSEQNFHDDVLTIVKNSKKYYRENMPYIEYIKTKLEVHIKKLFIDKLSQNESAFAIIENYINIEKQINKDTQTGCRFTSGSRFS